MYTHDPHAVLPTEIQEDPKLTDAAKGVAEPADDDRVFLPEAGEHTPPQGTVLLIRPYLLNDGIGAEALHPLQVFFLGSEGLRKEKVSDHCHGRWVSLPLIYEDLSTLQMILRIILPGVPALAGKGLPA